MANANPKKQLGDLRPDPKTDIDDQRDPEFEIPDPAQVEKGAARRQNASITKKGVGTPLLN